MRVEDIRVANARSLREQFYPGYGGGAAFAARVGLSRQYVNNIIGPSPTKAIGPEVARAIERAFDKPDGWLDHAHSPDSPELVTVVRADAALALRSGRLPGAMDASVVQLGVTRDWVRLNLPGSAPDSLAVHAVQDDAMAPALVSGSVALVDESVRSVAGDGVYLLARGEGGELMMRRVCRAVDGALHITADAPGHPATTIKQPKRSGLSVLGRVVGALTFRRM